MTEHDKGFGQSKKVLFSPLQWLICGLSLKNRVSEMYSCFMLFKNCILFQLFTVNCLIQSFYIVLLQSITFMLQCQTTLQSGGLFPSELNNHRLRSILMSSRSRSKDWAGIIFRYVICSVNLEMMLSRLVVGRWISRKKMITLVLQQVNSTQSIPDHIRKI